MNEPPVTKPFVAVDPTIASDDDENAKSWYRDSDWQPLEYGSELPYYVNLLREVIASAAPRSVLEFGCNGGRNLEALRLVLPTARLTGIDVNAKAITWGKGRYPNLELAVGDEATLSTIAADRFDVTFTVSVIDHVHRTNDLARQLVRVTSGYLILLEITNEHTGKITKMTDASGNVVDGYPFSYFHDYRALFERELHCLCITDSYVPVGRGNLLEFYRLYVFSKRLECFGDPLIGSLWLTPIR